MRTIYAAVAVAAALIGSMTSGARAGTIELSDTTTGNPQKAIYSPTLSYSNGGSCFVNGTASDNCGGYFIAPNTIGGTQVTQIKVINDGNSQFTTYAYSTQSWSASAAYSNPTNGYTGVSITVAWSGSLGAQQILGYSFADYQGYSYVNQFGACGSCVGLVTGGVQDAFTVDYLDAGNNVLGSDTVAFQGQGGAAPAPEPASLSLLGAGLAGLGWLRRRRSAGR